MREYENIRKTSENREPQRAYYIPYSTLEEALADKKEASPYYKLLNGEWCFKYFERDRDIPDEIKEWDKIPVPSCWQAHGYGDIMYTNINYPHPVDPPYVPDDNPAGVYKRDFYIDGAWLERETYIVFEGVTSCFYVYINGVYVGFSQGSHLEAEFDISKYLNEGNNTITVKVLRFSVGNYLEDQDFFRFSGIFRDVYLLSREHRHIKDVFIKADTRSISVSTPDYLIYDGDKCIGKEVEHPILWSAEKPHLYTVIVKGETEYIPFKVGMRDIKISAENELLINGVSVKLKGVNRHDTHPTNGYTMTDEEHRTDLLKMKELNINCIRMSHYPPTPEVLKMCDEMGFYVVDETDIETHGFGNRYPFSMKSEVYDIGAGEWPCEMPEWQDEFLERMERMMRRDKNFSCIFMWSTGNESGHSENVKRMIDFAREYDPSRLIHCEDLSHMCAEHGYECRDYAEKYSDVYSRMYLPIPDCADFCEKKPLDQPFFHCEFAHASGIGPGDIRDYVECMYKYKNYIGGCIWEWADHVYIKDGVPSYGGDFGERIHDGIGCVDGIVFYDRSFSSGSLAVKYAYQNIYAELSNGRIKLCNRFDFTDLAERSLRLELSVDGRIIEEMSLCKELPPHGSCELEIPFDMPKECKYGAYVNIYLQNDGFTEGMYQLELPVPRTAHVFAEPLMVEADGELLKAKGDGFEYSINKIYGNIVSIKKAGKDLLSKPTALTVYRAPTDNERREKFNQYLYDDNEAAENLNRLCSKVYETEVLGNTVTVKGSLSGISRAPFLRYTLTYSFYKNGEMKVSLSGRLRDNLSTYLPRLGFEFTSPVSNDSFVYFAHGREESYCDMHYHTLAGMYESRAGDEFVPYPLPEEHGNHYGAKMLKMSGGLEFFSEGSFEFNVSEYTAEALEAAKHVNEIEKNGCTNIRIDYKNSGIGSASVGPRLLPEYRLSDKNIEFSFIVMC